MKILTDYTATEAFYEDIVNSKTILQKIKSLENKISKYENLILKLDDLFILLELINEENDDEFANEFQVDYEKFCKSLEEIKIVSLLSERYDKNNALLTFHSGAGGTEAQDWCEMLIRMYLMWAKSNKYEAKILDSLEGDETGIKSAILEIKGENAYGYAKSENGVHRLVRISPFDASGRRHTSFASVEVIPETEDDENVIINTDDIKIDTFRASGAGGQHINKTDSAVRITHIPTGIVVTCQSDRSQHKNKSAAMKVLHSKLVKISESEQKAKLESLKGTQKDNAWGSQIRSYVLYPYNLVKDHRTHYETGNTTSVLNGEINNFMNAYLKFLKCSD